MARLRQPSNYSSVTIGLREDGSKATNLASFEAGSEDNVIIKVETLRFLINQVKGISLTEAVDNLITKASSVSTKEDFLTVLKDEIIFHTNMDKLKGFLSYIDNPSPIPSYYAESL